MLYGLLQTRISVFVRNFMKLYTYGELYCPKSREYWNVFDRVAAGLKSWISHTMKVLKIVDPFLTILFALFLTRILHTASAT